MVDRYLLPVPKTKNSRMYVRFPESRKKVAGGLFLLSFLMMTFQINRYLSTKIAFVVKASSIGSCPKVLINSANPLFTSGSPPVNLIFLTPISTKTLAISMSSSEDMNSALSLN